MTRARPQLQHPQESSPRPLLCTGYFSFFWLARSCGSACGVVYEPVAYPDTVPTCARRKTSWQEISPPTMHAGPPGTRSYSPSLAYRPTAPGRSSRSWVWQPLSSSFYVAFTTTRRPGFAALVGMTYNLNLSQLFFEANLISESTATFAVSGVAALLLVSYQRLRDKGRAWPWLLLLGLLAAFATLARPQFIFLPLLIATLIGYASYTRAGARAWRSAGCAGLVFLTSIVPILGWCWFNYVEGRLLHHLNRDWAVPDGPHAGFCRACPRPLRDHP